MFAKETKLVTNKLCQIFVIKANSVMVALSWITMRCLLPQVLFGKQILMY